MSTPNPPLRRDRPGEYLVGAKGFEPLTSSASSKAGGYQKPLVRAPNHQTRWSTAFWGVPLSLCTDPSSRGSVNFSSTFRQRDDVAGPSFPPWRDRQSTQTSTVDWLAPRAAAIAVPPTARIPCGSVRHPRRFAGLPYRSHRLCTARSRQIVATHHSGEQLPLCICSRDPSPGRHPQ
jgi:hypothetical protein